MFHFGSALVSGGEPCPRLAGSIPRLYPWVYYACSIISKIRNCMCNSTPVKMNPVVPPDDSYLGRRLLWALN